MKQIKFTTKTIAKAIQARHLNPVYRCGDCGCLMIRSEYAIKHNFKSEFCDSCTTKHNRIEDMRADAAWLGHTF